MATWVDMFSLFMTLTLIGGVVYGIIYMARAFSNWSQSKKEELQAKGYNVSTQGISIKTSKHFDRENYLDATQRGFVNALKASSVQHRDYPLTEKSDTSHNSVDAPPTKRSMSPSASEKKRKRDWLRSKIHS